MTFQSVYFCILFLKLSINLVVLKNTNLKLHVLSKPKYKSLHFTIIASLIVLFEIKVLCILLSILMGP